jgi:hypothetical protein
MSKEVLYVPEDHLLEVIQVIRAGLKTEQVSPETREQLTRWCDEEEQYISGSGEDEESD